MDTQTLQQLEQVGIIPTTVAEFLGLSPAEEALIEIKVRFTILLKQTRAEREWTQAQLAKSLQTTQQAVARAERGGEGVSLDFLLRALVALGLSLADLGDELHALDATLHPETASASGLQTADCHEESACAHTEPMSAGEIQISLVDKDSFIDAEKVAAAAQTPAPMLDVIRVDFRKGRVLSSHQTRSWSSLSREADVLPRAAAG